MGGGDGQGVAQAQRAELGAGEIGVDGVDLVRHQVGLLVALAQVFRDRLVGGAHAGAGVDHEQHRIGLFDGLQGLFGHLRVDALLVT